jgi:DNA-binding response OmpR family regulator
MSPQPGARRSDVRSNLMAPTVPVGAADVAERILVIDDEAPLRTMLEFGLAQYGFATRVAASGNEGLAHARSWQPRVIVLDVMLPDGDGLSLMARLRRFTDAPIVLLSAKSEVEDRIAGLDRGADDYLGKPFDFGELVARLRAALRRPALRGVTRLAYASLTIDLERRYVVRGMRRIELSPSEYDLLVAMLRRPERAFEKRELMEIVWRDALPSSTRSLDRAIATLRAKVDRPGERRLIATVRGIGYSVRDD